MVSLADILNQPGPVNLLASQPSSAGQLAGKLTSSAGQLAGKLNRRPGVLAGKLAAGVSDLLASQPGAPAELVQLAGKSADNLLASQPSSAADLTLLAGKLKAAKQPVLDVKQSNGGRARARKLSPERRREIAMLGVAARRLKK